VFRLFVILCLSLAVTALLGTEAGLSLFAAVVGLHVAAQISAATRWNSISPSFASGEAAELSAVVGRVVRGLNLPVSNVVIENSSVPNAYTVGVLPN
jgi:hypothetical protein